MKKAFIIIWLQIFATVQCEEFVAIWAPRHAPDNLPYSVFYQSADVNKNTEISIQYRKNAVTTNLKSQTYQRIEFQNNYPKSVSDFYVTLLRNETTGQKICSTQELKIATERRKFFIFIQLDKPIYKPGDEIQARVIVVDRNLMPYQMNNIKITIHEPFGRVIYQNEDLEGQSIGVVELNYKVTDYAIIGDWRIRVEVENRPEWSSSKVIPVQKYVLPLFDITVEQSDVHVILKSNVTLSFYAKYPFGDFVTGNAEVVFKSADGKVYKTEKFTNVRDVQKVTYHVSNDLNILIPSTASQVKVEAVIVFEEPESGSTYNKTVNFFVHSDKKYQLVLNYPERFFPNMPFGVKATVYDWKNNKVNSHFEKVFMTYSYKYKNGNTASVTTPIILDGGVAAHEIIPSNDVVYFEVECKFINSKIVKSKIDEGRVGIEVQGLKVEHSPLKPQLDDIVTIYVRSDTPMTSLLMVVTSMQGNMESKRVSCYDMLACSFELVINEEMMPQSTITVYHVANQKHIYHGSTKIITDGLGSNDLTLTLSTNQASSRDTISMSFEASRKSKIYILAYDKNLNFLRQGNDVTRNDVRGAYADFDDSYNILLLDMSDKSAWHDCTPEEVSRVEENRNSLGQQSGDTLRPADDKNLAYDSFDENFIEDEFDSEIDEEFLRSDFPETWIFESIELGKKQMSITKDFQVPDTMTTWLISAFAVKEDFRLAIAPAQELVVKNEFFIKVNLPYSIRFTEVLRLDVLVYNYVSSGDSLDVLVQLDNLRKTVVGSKEIKREFEFVEYSNECKPKYNSNSKAATRVVVPNMSIKRVSFYVRANPNDNDFDLTALKKILFQVRALGRGSNGEYMDSVQQRLLVEPVGIRDYDVKSKLYKINGEEEVNWDFFGNTSNVGLDDSRNYPITNVVISGDYLSNFMSLPSKFEFYPYLCLEQRTSRLKGNIEYYRYKLIKDGIGTLSTQFYQYYQKLLNERLNFMWSYRKSFGYRAYFVEAFIAAIELKAIPEAAINYQFIETELNTIMSNQNPNGSFPSTNFPVYYASQYFYTAYALITFVKYQNLRNDSTLYQDVVTKGYEYLSNNVNNQNYEAYAVAAYAFAVNNNQEMALQVLQKIQSAKIIYPNRQKCFRLAVTGDCNFRHTAFAALANIELKRVQEAELLVNWLLSSYNRNYYYSNTYDYAIATEAIAKMGTYLKVSSTNLLVQVANEFNHLKKVKITNENSDFPHDFEFPEYTRNVTTIISGNGYCTVTTIFEYKVYIPRPSEYFGVYINVNAPGSNNEGEKVIEVCSYYKKPGEILQNVNYEIELPSGYTYVEVTNLQDISNDLKQVEHKRERTLVILYYEQFSYPNSYCAKIKMRKTFEIRNVKDAGVKIYNYEDKESVAIDFYHFGQQTCTN